MATRRRQQAKEEAPEKEAEGAPDSPLPLLDLSDAGVKKMIKAAKKRGYRHLRRSSTPCCPPRSRPPSRSKT